MQQKHALHLLGSIRKKRVKKSSEGRGEELDTVRHGYLLMRMWWKDAECVTKWVLEWKQRKKTKQKDTGLNEDSNEEDAASSNESMNSDAEDALNKKSMRGTVLVTLRNTSPYTLW